MNNEYIVGSVVALSGALFGFLKYLLNKKNVVREILERQIDQLEKKELELQKKIDELQDQLNKLIVRSRGKK